MRCSVCDLETLKEIKVVDAKPQCGEDFCDRCGDCLHCHGREECPETESGDHVWIHYENDR